MRNHWSDSGLDGTMIMTYGLDERMISYWRCISIATRMSIARVTAVLKLRLSNSDYFFDDIQSIFF